MTGVQTCALPISQSFARRRRCLSPTRRTPLATTSCLDTPAYHSRPSHKWPTRCAHASPRVPQSDPRLDTSQDYYQQGPPQGQYGQQGGYPQQQQQYGQQQQGCEFPMDCICARARFVDLPRPTDYPPGPPLRRSKFGCSTDPPCMNRSSPAGVPAARPISGQRSASVAVPRPGPVLKSDPPFIAAAAVPAAAAPASLRPA